MTHTLSGPEIFMLLATGLLLGGSTGMITGWIANRLFSHLKQPRSTGVLLGIVGYWAGAYISSAVWQAVTDNEGAVKTFLLAAVAGSMIATVLGSLAISYRRLTLERSTGEH